MSLVFQIPFNHCRISKFLNVYPNVVFSNDTTNFSKLACWITFILNREAPGNRQTTTESSSCFLFIKENCFTFDCIPNFNMIISCVSSENISRVAFRNCFSKNYIRLYFTLIQSLINMVEVIAKQNSMLFIIPIA